jgi:hypothetical protein
LALHTHGLVAVLRTCDQLRDTLYDWLAH